METQLREAHHKIQKLQENATGLQLEVNSFLGRLMEARKAGEEVGRTAAKGDLDGQMRALRRQNLNHTTELGEKHALEIAKIRTKCNLGITKARDEAYQTGFLVR
jgi:hypothetical protein